MARYFPLDDMSIVNFS